MTTPRDFVKQDSTLTLQQRCENFLDQLAAKGATDTLFLFEELLEVFPVGRTLAITILRDWQAKRAPSTQCQHGQLARQCLLCEQAAEIKRLRQMLRNLMGVAEYWFIKVAGRDMSESEYRNWHSMSFGSKAYQNAKQAALAGEEE